jgi:hypothetical protein
MGGKAGTATSAKQRGPHPDGRDHSKALVRPSGLWHNTPRTISGTRQGDVGWHCHTGTAMAVCHHSALKSQQVREPIMKVQVYTHPG